MPLCVVHEQPRRAHMKTHAANCSICTAQRRDCLTKGAHLAQYWSRRLGGAPMPALVATKHCDTTPSTPSLARFTSRYSSVPGHIQKRIS